MTFPSPYIVLWKGPINKPSGLGIASREYVRALRQLGVNVAISAKSAAPFSKKNKVLIYHHSLNSLNIKKERKHFKTIIINTVWETTRIPKRWIGQINQADAVCVPSYQNKQALLNSGIRIPIFIVPHGVNARMYTPMTKLPLKKTNRTFTFISVFGFQHRKNPEALLKAYWEEFSAADNVQLIIKTNGYAPYENERWIRNRILAYKHRLNIKKSVTPPIQLITQHLNSRALRSIYSRGNAFVLPTRGEGVGLPFLESMASGVPIIATGWGGHMDFLTSKNSFLVPYKLRPPTTSMNRKSSISRQFRHLFAEKGQLWAEPDIGSLRKQMRRAYENPGLCKLKGQQARHDALHLSWNRAGLSFKKAIESTIRFKK